MGEGNEEDRREGKGKEGQKRGGKGKGEEGREGKMEKINMFKNLHVAHETKTSYHVTIAGLGIKQCCWQCKSVLWPLWVFSIFQ